MKQTVRGLFFLTLIFSACTAGVESKNLEIAEMRSLQDQDDTRSVEITTVDGEIQEKEKKDKPIPPTTCWYRFCKGIESCSSNSADSLRELAETREKEHSSRVRILEASCERINVYARCCTKTVVDIDEDWHINAIFINDDGEEQPVPEIKREEDDTS